MTTPTSEDRNAKTTSASMDHVKSRYLKPKIGSCHDRCKNGTNDETEIIKPKRKLGVRKILVKKNKVKRSVEPVERKKLTKTKPKPKPLPSKRIGVSVYGLLTNRKSTQNMKAKKVSPSIMIGQNNKKEVKNTKNTRIVSKSTSEEQVASSPTNDKLVSPLNDEHSMTKTEFKQLITEKITEITEMTLDEAENAELELVPLTVEIETPQRDDDITNTELKQLITEKIDKLTLQEAENEELEFVPLTVEIESTPTVTTESTTNPPLSETSQPSSDNQVSIEERENTNFVSEHDGPMMLKVRRGKTLKDDDNDGPIKLKFRRGKILENDEDDGPIRLKFRRGKILEIEDEESIGRIKYKERLVEEVTDDSETETERVNLKHQEMKEKKEAQELLNRKIEETASKLEVDRKTKVEALVGAFESVMTLKDDDAPSPQ